MLDILSNISLVEASGLVFGLVCVILLIRQNILTWPFGIAYVLVSFYIFYQARLYADLALNVYYLWMNIYGWYFWTTAGVQDDGDVPVTTERPQTLVVVLLLSTVAILALGLGLRSFTDASLPFWDSTTTMLSVSAMWLTARKKIESWHLWLLVDVLLTGIYFYKGLYFYSALYFVYIGLAIMGFLAWKSSMNTDIIDAV